MRPLLLLSFVVLAVGCDGCRRSKLASRSDGAAVVIAPVEGEPGMIASDEVEPNDQLGNAQKLDFGAGTALMVNATLGSAPASKTKDVDLYHLIVPPPAVVTAAPDGAAPPPRRRLAVEVHPGPDLAVSVDALDDQGKALVSAGGATAGEAEGLPNLSVLPGTYYLRVRAAPVAGGAGGAGGGRRDGAQAGAAAVYRLKVRLHPVDPGDEVEPNGKGALAGDVAPGGEIAGFLGWRRDEDWFRLPLAGLPEGSVLDADLDPLEGVAVALAVHDSVEHKLTEQRGRRGERVAIRNIRLPPSEPHMYLVVRAEAGRNLEARYVLHLRTEEAKSDAELEPNDDPAHAVALADGQVTGYLGPADVDVYKYTATSPVELDIEATPPERVDIKLEVLGADGAVVAKIDGGKRREPERLPNLYVSGSVLVRLSGGKGDGNLDEPYRLAVTSRPAAAGAEREPNGSAALATPLAAGAEGSGLIYPRGDVDYWRVQVAPAGPGGSLAVSVRGIPDVVLDVRVHGASGQGRELARFRAGGDAPAPPRVTPGADGCCVVQIKDPSGRAANPRDRYTLSVAP